MAKKTLNKKKVEKLTKIQEKRVAIAKDAIAQLKAEVYITQRGGYVGLDYEQQKKLEGAISACEIFTGKNAEDFEFNKIMDKVINKKTPCEVCAKGSLFLSAIRKFNNFSLIETDDLDAEAHEESRKIFGEDNADLIEIFYERWTNSNRGTKEFIENQDEKVEEWFKKYPDDKDRLIAILTNVVKNKGIFVPYDGNEVVTSLKEEVNRL